MSKPILPFLTPNMRAMLSREIMPIATLTVSGEVTAHTKGHPLGAALRGGRVSDVWLSVAASGKDDSNALKLEVDVKINGTSCLTTKPYVSHVSGEASQHKTTLVTGDTGIAQAVMDASNNLFAAGDVFSVDTTLTRTASPTTEMANACIVVEFEPIG